MTNKKGFSLPEVLIAIVILVGAIITVSGVWSGNTLRIRKSRVYNHVGFLLEKKMVEIELKYEGEALASIPEEESGDFGPEYKDYRWEFNSQEFEMPDLKSLYLASEENDTINDTLVMVLTQMKEYMSKTIKEASVTVYVKIKDKESSFSVSTYFVDYNQAFTLSGGGGT